MHMWAYPEILKGGLGSRLVGLHEGPVLSEVLVVSEEYLQTGSQRKSIAVGRSLKT